MFRKTLSGLCVMAMVFSITFVLTPSNAMAQKSGSGGSSSGGGGSGGGGSGGGGGGGGGGGTHDLPSLQASLVAESTDDPLAYGQATATPGALGDGQTFSMQVDGVYSATVVSVYINGVFLGYIDIDEFGIGSSLYTLGYYGGVNPVTAPIIHSGDQIDVYDADTNTLLLAGTFK